MRRLIPALLLLGACGAPEQSVPTRATVMVFITTDCPIANSFAPEIQRIIRDYRPRGVTFVMVYTDPHQEQDAAFRHAREYGYESLVLVDGSRIQSRKHGITVTPEAVVVVGDERVYRGRIDDRYLAPGQYRLKPTTRELRDAIEAVLDGRPVAVAETKAAGCPLTD
jgi:hypothetical protein